MAIGASNVRANPACVPYAKVRRLMPGGPAAKCAQVRVGDRIVAVAQGNGPFVDTREVKLDDVIELIGAKRGRHSGCNCFRQERPIRPSGASSS